MVENLLKIFTHPGVLLKEYLKVIRVGLRFLRIGDSERKITRFPYTSTKLYNVSRSETLGDLRLVKLPTYPGTKDNRVVDQVSL